jgi:hypothetical protein
MLPETSHRKKKRVPVPPPVPAIEQVPVLLVILNQALK